VLELRLLLKHLLEGLALCFDAELQLSLDLKLLMELLLHLHLHLQCLCNLVARSEIKGREQAVLLSSFSFGFFRNLWHVLRQSILLEMTLNMVDCDSLNAHQSQHCLWSRTFCSSKVRYSSDKFLMQLWSPSQP
jgi:hypothetical protein